MDRDGKGNLTSPDDAVRPEKSEGAERVFRTTLTASKDSDKPIRLSVDVRKCNDMLPNALRSGVHHYAGGYRVDRGLRAYIEKETHRQKQPENYRLFGLSKLGGPICE